MTNTNETKETTAFQDRLVLQPTGDAFRKVVNLKAVVGIVQD